MAVKNRLSQVKADAKKAGWLSYLRSENDERALLDGCTVDVSKGEHVCEFFRTFLRHPEDPWAGQPFELAEWQKRDVVMPLFSWLRADGTRRFRRAQIWVPKKNGKSALVSGFLLYMLCADGERGAKVYCAACKREQAAIVWETAHAYVKASPNLSKHLRVIPSTKRIIKDVASWFEPLSADAKSSEGLKAHAWGIDELHVFDERGRDLRNSLRYAGSARRQPMEIVASTAGDELGGIGREEYEQACAIRDCLTKNSDTFVYIAEAPEGADWTKPKTWEIANPALGITVQKSALAEECESAIQAPRLQNVFKRYRLNIWTAAETTALPMGKWAECANAVEPESLLGLPCAAGIDLSSTTDLTAFALCFRLPQESGDEPQRFAFKVWMFLPQENIVDRERNDRMPYRELAEAGHLILTPGNTVDYGVVTGAAKDACGNYNPSEFAFDPWNAKKWAEDFGNDTGIQMVEVPQTTLYLNAASKLFESLVIDRRMSHEDNPILNKMAADLCWWTDSQGNIRPMKNDAKKRRRRIDGITASIMALSRAMLGVSDRSIYEDQELMVI